jgi:hypothetical protein
MARNNEIPYKIIDIFTEIVRTLSSASFEGRMPDLEGFTVYLTSNTRLHDAAVAVHIKQQSKIEAKNRVHEEYLVREACRQSRKEADALLTSKEKAKCIRSGVLTI